VPGRASPALARRPCRNRHCPFQTALAICNPPSNGVADGGVSKTCINPCCRAPLNDWLVKELASNRDAALRGSIVIPNPRAIEKSVAEIERLGAGGITPFRPGAEAWSWATCRWSSGAAVADLRYRGTAGPAPNRQSMPGSALFPTRLFPRLGFLITRGLCRPRACLPDPISTSPDRGGRNRKQSEPEMVMLESGFTWLPGLACGGFEYGIIWLTGGSPGQ